MKLSRGIMYVGVASLTLISGVGAVAGARRAYAAIADQITAPSAPPQMSAEPAAPQVYAEPVIVESAPDDSCSTAEDERSAFDPTGSYYMDTETVPKAFSDIDHLELETHEYVEKEDQYVARPIVPRGAIYAGKTFKLARLAVSESELAFQTETVDGVSYRFVGRFRSEQELEEGGPTLIGKMIKIKDGKWAAEVDAEFYLQCGC